MNVSLNDKIGAKEFHEILAVIKASQMYSLPQLEQLCKDVQVEMNRNVSWTAESVGFIAKYYCMDWDCLQVRRLGKFVKQGHFRKALEIYGV